MIRWPERTAGVWVATLTPATSTSAPLRRSSRSLARVTPSASSSSSWKLMTWRLMSMPRISSSASTISVSVISGSSPGAMCSANPSGSCTAACGGPGPASGCSAWRCAVLTGRRWRRPAPARRPGRSGRAGSARRAASGRRRRAADRAARRGRRPGRSAPAIGREGRARSQKSASEVYGRPATMRSTSASLTPLIAENGTRSAYPLPISERRKSLSRLGRSASPSPAGSTRTWTRGPSRSTRQSLADLFTSSGRISTPHCRASSMMTRVRVHAGVVGEHPGEERGRVVPLEPGRLVGGQRERRRVRLAEPEPAERVEHLPGPLHGLVAEPVRPGQRHEALAHPVTALRRCRARAAADSAYDRSAARSSRR